MPVFLYQIILTYKTGNGRLKEIAYANGDKMKATYNGVGQMVAEKWYNSSNELTAHYKYVYDGQGNIVRSIDILGQKEYNYEYDAGKVVRATESDIALSDEMVVSKSLVNTVKYYYDTDDKMTKKVITSASGSAQTIYYENSEDNTVVKFNAGGKTITAHSKTDSFGRKVFDELQLGTGFVSRQFSYHSGDVTQEHKDNAKLKSSATTQLVSQIVLSGGRTISYEYDPEERITKVIDSVDGETVYTYDALGQLLTEKHKAVGAEEYTTVNAMTYDRYGNIKTKNGVEYVYDEVWRDKLIAYDGVSITYDAQGNPLSYRGHTLTWEKGRQLKSFDGNTYTYNANGIRTSKTVDGIQHEYLLDGAKILRETWDGNNLVPIYDNEESVCGIIYNEAPYYFLKNLQGDIIGIVDKDAEVVAKYSYDAWGVCTVTMDNSCCDIANINPFRYRSYYFDKETGLYYLQSRYYDPALGRFVNGDEPEFACIIDDNCLANLFVYCMNCSTTYSEIMGCFPNIGKFFKSFKNKLNRFINIFKRLISGVIEKYSVTVIMTKKDSGWYNSSVVMGNDLRKAIGATKSKVVKVDSRDFLTTWKKIKSSFVIIHTHGSPNGLFATGSEITNVDKMKNAKRNNNIKLVVCTACQTAAKNGKKDNIATVLSKKINKKGITIANEYTVHGGDKEFIGMLKGKAMLGWNAYKNGQIITADIPETLTMEIANEIYKDLK